MNYLELKNAWRKLAKRPDLDDEVCDIFQTLLRARLGRDIKNSDTLASVAPNVTADGWELPEELVEIDTIEAGTRTLDYVTPYRFSLEAWANVAQVYTIKLGRLFVNVPASISIGYWRKPDALVNDGDTNALLSAWPNLYIYGGLSEVYRYHEEVAEVMQRVDALYMSDVELANEQGQRKRVGPNRVIGGI